jgi:hypothetical protein
VHISRNLRGCRRRTVRIGAAGALGAALVAGVAACGDQPTANRDYYAVATHSAYSAREIVFLNSGPLLVSHAVLSGYLIDAAGKPVPGSLFHEDCGSLVTSGFGPPFHPPTTCTATVMTGKNTYVARGQPQFELRGGVHGPYYGMFGSLGPGGGIGPGSAVMWLLPDGSGINPIHMKISLRLWGSEPVALS